MSASPMGREPRLAAVGEGTVREAHPSKGLRALTLRQEVTMGGFAAGEMLTRSPVLGKEILRPWSRIQVLSWPLATVRNSNGKRY